MTQPTDMADAKTRLARKKYATLMLDAFDRLEHQDKRAQKEKAAETWRAARQKL